MSRKYAYILRRYLSLGAKLRASCCVTSVHDMPRTKGKKEEWRAMVHRSIDGKKVEIYREFRANLKSSARWWNKFQWLPDLTEIWHCNGCGDLTFVSFHGTTIANLSNETRFDSRGTNSSWSSLPPSSSHCRVNRRSSIKILPGWTMSVPVKRNWSRLISKLDASSNAFSRGLQLTGRNNDSFNPVRQRVLKDGPSAIGHEMKRIYGNYKVYAVSKPVESSYEFHWPRTAINENLLISRQLCFIFISYRNIFDRCLSQLIFADTSFWIFNKLYLRFNCNYMIRLFLSWECNFYLNTSLFNNKSWIYLSLFLLSSYKYNF